MSCGMNGSIFSADAHSITRTAYCIVSHMNIALFGQLWGHEITTVLHIYTESQTLLTWPTIGCDGKRRMRFIAVMGATGAQTSSCTR